MIFLVTAVCVERDSKGLSRAQYLQDTPTKQRRRLDRKVGGDGRQIAIKLEQVKKIKPLQPDNSKDIENLANLLDNTVINLKAAERAAEL